MLIRGGQRRGTGTRAPKGGGGTEQAQAEGLPVVMKASLEGGKLYEKAGLREAEEGDWFGGSLRCVGREGRWMEKALEKADAQERPC
jgi:hypothetical protein